MVGVPAISDDAGFDPIVARSQRHAFTGFDTQVTDPLLDRVTGAALEREEIEIDTNITFLNPA
jgi:hypothetical protein